MTEATPNTVLKRKAQAGREDHLSRAMTVPKAMRVVAAKVAEDMFQLPLATLSVTTDSFSVDELADRLDEEKMLLLLDGSQGFAGVAVLDTSFVGGLIQQQTMGRVLPANDDVRVPTHTDAALCAPFIDELLKRVPQVLEIQTDKDLLQGFTFGALAEEVRAVTMALEAFEFHQYQVTFDMFKGARQGVLTLIIPVVEDNMAAIEIGDFDEEEPAPTGQNEMANRLMEVDALLSIDLCRLRMSLGDVHNLKVGQVIDLPPGLFPNVSITGLEGQAIGQGKLGQVEGQRAVRPDRPPNYADKPMRRESDQADLDLPDVAGIEESEGGMPDLGGGGVPALPPMEPMPDLDMPALEGEVDMPDLADLPSADDPEPLAAPEPFPDMEDLPELDDLPDLADLPDLGDLPDLKSA